MVSEQVEELINQKQSVQKKSRRTREKANFEILEENNIFKENFLEIPEKSNRIKRFSSE